MSTDKFLVTAATDDTAAIKRPAKGQSRNMRIRYSVAFVTAANRGLGLAFAKESLGRGVKKLYAGVRNPLGMTGRSGQSAGDEARGGASGGADRARGHRQHGAVPGFRGIANGHRTCVSGGQRGDDFVNGRGCGRIRSPNPKPGKAHAG